MLEPCWAVGQRCRGKLLEEEMKGVWLNKAGLVVNTSAPAWSLGFFRHERVTAMSPGSRDGAPGASLFPFCSCVVFVGSFVPNKDFTSLLFKMNSISVYLIRYFQWPNSAFVFFFKVSLLIFMCMVVCFHKFMCMVAPLRPEDML